MLMYFRFIMLCLISFNSILFSYGSEFDGACKHIVRFLMVKAVYLNLFSGL